MSENIFDPTGGSEPEYDEDGHLKPMSKEETQLSQEEIMAQLKAAAEAAPRQERKANLDPPTSRHGIALYAANEELEIVMRSYPELAPFLQKLSRIMKEGLLGVQQGS